MTEKAKRIITLSLAVCLLLSLLPWGLVAAQDVPRAVFGNEPVEELYLDVTKTVTADEGVLLPEGWENKEFTFTLRKGDTPVGNLSFVYVTDGQEVTPGSQTNANGRFVLKHGQTARFKDIEKGVQYTVTEEPESGSNYSLKKPSGSSGYSDIISEATRWEFVNEYVPTPPPESHKLRVKKTVTVPEGFFYTGEEDFTFLLELDKAPATGIPYSVWDSAGRHVRDSLTDDKTGQFVLKGGETAEFDIVGSEDYLVKELLSDTLRGQGWRIIGSDSFEGPVAGSPTLEFTNTNAALVVHKILSDNSTSGDIFTFQLIDTNNRGMAGVHYYVYDRSHQLVDVDWTEERTQPLITNEAGEFTLKAGQYAYFTDIPEGADVRVAEQYLDGYNLVVTDANSSFHTITGRALTLVFENTPVKRSGLYVSKVVRDLLPNEVSPDDDDFTFTLYRKNSSGEYVPYKANYTLGEGTSAISLSTDAFGRFSIKKAQTAKFNYLPLGDYKVVEDSLEGRVEYISLEGEDGIEGAVIEGDILNINYQNQYKPQMLDIVITKTDADAPSRRLSGAVFSIYTDEALRQRLRDSVEAEDEKGLYTLSDLKPGTYYLVETKAPLGYYPMSKAVKIDVVLETYVEEGEEENRLTAYIYDDSEKRTPVTKEINASLFSAKITPETEIGDDGFQLNDELCMSISDTYGNVLPGSGGYALWIYTIVPITVLGAFIILLRTQTLRRKKYKLKNPV